tara:strand:- start:4465 stop:4671 length:207 start_codon:yes stop_codon:yes gene_type:complete
MKIDWEQKNIRVFGRIITFEEARGIAVEYIEPYVQQHRVRSEGLKTTIDWRSVFYSTKFRRLLIFLHI